MKFQMTLLVFREGEKQGEIDVVAEFPDAVAAIRAVAQLGAANSLLFTHPDVKALHKGLPPKSLARLHETMDPGTVIQIKDVQEYREEIPEELRRDPMLLYHVVASRPVRTIPPEGIIETPHTGPVH